MSWFDTHRATLERAVEVARTREAWAPYIESPSRKHHPEGAHARGREAFEARLGRPFDLSLPGERGRVGEEVSPFTGEALGVDYPDVEVEPLYAAIHAAWPRWAAAAPRERVGVCLELLDRWSRNAFENAYATMHTAGQPFMLAFAGSGASALERGLEGLTYAHMAMSAIPETATFERAFGRGAPPVRLHKRYRLVPSGIGVVISCGSYPSWNAYPAIMANLATGNPVVVKPHPSSTLPMAIAVKIGRDTLQEAGFDPNLLTLAADTRARPITKRLLQHPDTALIDFTGGQTFGDWIEANCHHAQVYTETSGCNSVILESTRDLDASLRAIAHGLTFFSGQMCTAAQNIWLPRDGVATPQGRVPADEVAARLVAAVDAWLADPTTAASLLGALCSPAIARDMDTLRSDPRVTVLRDGAPYAHPKHPDARTASPLIVRASLQDRDLYGREWFGPMAFILTADDRDHALALATRDARERGAIASYAYTIDPEYQRRLEDAYARAGASVGVNLTRQLPINFAAAFSDFHVTGANPAGNACLTDLAFVARRFRIVQSKTELPAPETP